MASIGYVDIASEKDALGVEQCYKGLTEFIINCPTPMTMSIQGDWGGGKTTALKLIEKNLNEKNLNQVGKKAKKKYHVIWFNTWQYSKFGMKDNMILALIEQLGFKLSEIAKEDKIKFGSSQKAQSVVKETIATTAATAMEFMVGENFSNRVNDGLHKILGMDYVPNIIQQIEDAKKRIEKNVKKIIKEDGERLVIFIDDLDRLEPETAVELLEGIKNLLDCEKCVFVLAVDSNVIYQGIRSKYGEDFGKDKEKKFFDKIIQVPFSIPMNQYDMKTYLETFLDEEDKKEIDGYERAVKTILGNNPRSIKRAFNRLELHKLILGDVMISNVKDRLNLFTILLIQMVEEDLYNELTNIKTTSKLDEKMKEEKYSFVREALDLPNAEDEVESTETEERLVNFIELLKKITEISGRVVYNERQTNSNRKEDENLDCIEIFDELKFRYQRYDVAGCVTNFMLKDGKKVCSFRKNEGYTNIVIYPVGKDNLKELTIKGTIKYEGKNPEYADEGEIGYRYNERYITLIKITENTNKALLREIMEFYDIL